MSRFDPIYAYVRTIPRGRVLSYGDVGGAVGETPRTVGWAMSGCPSDVPWQRVIGSDRTLRTAKRSPEAYAEQKARLIEEGVTFDEEGKVNEDCFGLVITDDPS